MIGFDFGGGFLEIFRGKTGGVFALFFWKKFRCFSEPIFMEKMAVFRPPKIAQDALVTKNVHGVRVEHRNSMAVPNIAKLRGLWVWLGLY